MGIFREACWPKIKISTIFPTGGSGDISEHLLTITAVHTEKEISSEKKTKITGAVCLKTATLTPLFAACNTRTGHTALDSAGISTRLR